MKSKPIPYFTQKFLDELDGYIAENYQYLTCADFHAIYSQHFEDLKKYKGNANGFTGLSEFLLFRFIYHLLGGGFDRRRVAGSHDLWEFIKEEPNLCLGQAVPVTPPGHLYPDISIRKDNVLMVMIEVKLYLSGGRAQLIEEMKRLVIIKELNPQVKALIILFAGISKKGVIYPVLEQAKAEAPWFDYLCLYDNPALLSSAICNSLPELFGTNA